MKDERIAYGATCSWWDSIHKVGKSSGSLSIPCCPYCKGVLFEMSNEKEWFRGVDTYARVSGKEDYRQFIEWLRGKCFKGGYPEALEAWATEKEK